MGRKTWESIPARFQPLTDRVNIVISNNKIEPPQNSVVHNLTFVNSLESAIQVATGSNKVFVIGGAQIYKAALGRTEAKRILLTRILDDFEFDTCFPLDLSDYHGKAGDKGLWERKSGKERNQWVGENLPDEVQKENNTRYVFEMWEKNDGTI